jgi:hypothetical protein
MGLLLAGGAVPAQAKTVKVCVKKSSGEMRLLTKKKCKKGWKKVTWNQKGDTGPQGNQGAQGPNLTVKDGTGKVLGRYVGLYPAGFALMFVEINSGIYLYAPNGQLFPGFSSSPSFKTNTCNGTAYIRSSSPQTTQLYTQSAGGPTRIVYRVTNPVPGAISAWALTATTESVNQTMYVLNSSGVCTADGNYNGTLVALQSVAAPADVPGPLTIS